MKNAFLFIIVSLSLLSTFSCSKELSVEERKLRDIEDIETYLIDHGLTADTILDSGLHAIIEEPGTGANPTVADDVLVAYKGYYTDDSVFQEFPNPDPSNPNHFFTLGITIQGWIEGIPLFKKGGKGTLLIPSYMGYAGSPPSNSSIPKHAILIFDVELIDF